MLKLFRAFILYFIIWVNSADSDHVPLIRQKMVLSLSQELYIKNIVLIKQSASIINTSTISFTKTLHQFNIYTSFLQTQEIINNNRAFYLKSLIVTFDEKYNEKVYGMISENEINASWLVWKMRNRTENPPYVPYNVQLLIAEDIARKNNDITYVSEIYHPRIFSQVMFKRHFGIWSENKGLEIPERDFYKRRLNMNGSNLKMYAVRNHFPRYTWIVALSYISSIMNFKTVLFVRNDSTAKTEFDYDIDLSPDLKDPKITSQAQVLGMIWKDSLYLYMRYDELLEDHGIITYVRPFSKQLWWGILISVLITGTFTLMMIHRNSSDFGFLSAFYHPLEAFMNQDGCEMPKSKSIRITILTSRFVAMFIVPAYSAFLLTYLLVPSIKLPFTSIEGLVQDGSYKVGFSQDSQYEEYFKDSDDIWHKAIYEKHLLKQNERPINHLDVLKKICYYRKVAFIIYEKAMRRTECNTIQIPEPFGYSWSGLLLKGKSPYKRIFSRMIKTVTSAGIKNKNEQELITWRTKGNNFNFMLNKTNSIKMESVKPILEILILLYVLAITILIFECLFKKFQSMNVVKLFYKIHE